MGKTRLRDAGVKDKVFMCSLPSRKSALLISGSPSLDEFRVKPRELSTFHQYVEENHIPFLSRGMSWFLLGDGSCRGVRHMLEEKRRWVGWGLPY